MHDEDIQFGEVQQTAPRAHLRPDRNKHFAVAPCGAPGQQDLPVFVELDVMRDMQAHARSDTRVELGGVMLGGQYQDEQGQPFVLVTDSLRAEHYESTKGSFKFTHDTWAEITRQRDEFPADWQMVGWYHTHPDWGVFLSGMDLFICDHFFNKPLDVALVLDPCRGDWGFFQWTGNPQQRVRRTGGFFLIASRFRRHELRRYAQQLEEKRTMKSDLRDRDVPDWADGYPAPVVNIAERPQSWQGVALAGMLTLQLALLTLLAWHVLTPRATAESSPPPPAVADRPDVEIEAQLQVLQRVLTGLSENTPQELVQSLVEQQQETNDLRAALRGQAALERELQQKNQELADSLAAAQQKGTQLSQTVDQLESQVDSLRQESRAQKDQIAGLQRELDAAQDADSTAHTDRLAGPRWLWWGGGLGLAVLVAAGGALVWVRRKQATQASRDGELPQQREDEGRVGR